MASSPVIADTGPLVALFNRRDAWHEWAKSVLADLAEPLLTCDAVLSEAVFLLANHTQHGVERLCSMIERGLLQSQFEFAAHREDILTVLRKYHDLPTSFADACLVAMAESDAKAKIFTVDSDFKLYRKRNRRVLPLIFPGQ